MGLVKELCIISIILTIFLFTQTDSIAVMSVDIGSEWLKVAIVKPGVPMEIALNKESRRKTPFVISMKGNERLFGDPALTVAVKQPKNAYIYLTHLIGKKYESAAVQQYKKRFPFYTLLKDENRGTVLFEGADGINYSVEELFGMMLNHTRHIAENFADHPMKDIVLTVPAFFNQAERKAVLDAANMIGLNVLQLMDDNTAVALNYGIFRASSFNATQRHIMFYDMGSSYTTATIVTYSTTKVKDHGYVETVPQLVVKGVGFDTKLGGFEMDIRLRDHFVKAFKAAHKTKVDITESPRAMAKLLKEAKRVRQVLSANTDHRAQIENVCEEIDFKLQVTRAELEEMCHDLYDHVKNPVKMALNAAAMTLDDIESVILMGGGTRIPKVQEMLLEVVKKQELGKSINTDEAAALGSVYKAADLTAGFKVKRFIVKDLNLFPVDVQFERRSSVEDGVVKIINRNLYHRLNPLPQKKIMTFNKKPNDFNFNVSYGDLTFLSEELRSDLLLDSISHVKLSGVDAAYEKNNKGTPKGVKAYFHLDESGILHVEKVEAHFEKTPEVIEEESQSTFAKLGSKLSSFFGSSKTEEETVETPKEEAASPNDRDKEKKEKVEEKEEKKEEKTEKAEEKKTNDSKDDKVNTTKPENATATNTTKGNGTEEVKIKQPVVVKEEVQFTYHANDVPTITKIQFEESQKKLNDLEARDRAKFATEMMHNNLESYIFDFKDKLEDESVQEVSTEEEREKIEKIFGEASEWIDEEGFEANEETLKKKLKSLKETTLGLQLKIDESVERPKAIASILQSLNLTGMFFGSLKTLPDVKEIYSEKDLKDLEKVVSEAKEWLGINWKKQNESDPTKKPVLLSRDILSQQGKVDREMMYLIGKAKYYVPKPKPKPNTTEFNTTKVKVNETTSNVNKTESDEKPKDKTGEESKSSTEKVNDENAKDDTKGEDEKEDGSAKESSETTTDSKESSETNTDAKESSETTTDAKESIETTNESKESSDAKDSSETTNESKESSETTTDAKESSKTTDETPENKSKEKSTEHHEPVDEL